MRLSAWLSLAATTLAAAIPLSTGCTQDFGQFEPQPEDTCGATEMSCDGVCVSRMDPAFGCGAGCEPCDVPGAVASCSAGACAVGECLPGLADCDMSAATGCEVDTATSEQHCGQCGNACGPAEWCAGGVCAGCEPGQADCDGDQGNGCEVDLQSDPDHCGDCATACPSGPNATATCQAGACGLLCADGFADCDLDAANGCEIDLTTDAANCGGCGRACATTHVATVTCDAGLCTSSCMDGFGNCAVPPAPGADDGCETDVTTSVDHCGACGRACSDANVASLSCSAGVCDSTCDLGYGNCNRPAAGADDGCEDNVLTDDEDCGGCSIDCGDQGNGFECDAGPNGAQQFCGCGPATECDTDGNGPASGTCSNMGLCSCDGSQCSPGEACAHDGVMSVCSCNGGAGCGPGMACCPTPIGCVDPLTDPQSCGACGRACPAGFACASGGCVCDAEADCDAGNSGTIACNATGRCVCDGTTCAPGERCQADGTCG